jgi:hypothetical protein
MFTDSGGNTISYTGALSSWPVGSTSNPTSYPMMGVGLTGNGNVVMATSYGGSSSQSLGIFVSSPQVTWSPGQPAPYQVSSSSYYAPYFNNTVLNINGIVGDIAAQPRVTPLTGNNCLITFRNTSNYPAYIIVNGSASTATYVVVAGTTVSSLVPVASIGNSSTVGISGVFAGVALTTASAGSTGQLAINGPVLLGSSYTTTATGAFDSTGNAVSGVKGTFNGRSVNLQGNS